eukprot:TRINITY_DN24767_c0_g1_i1.p1 TRINITY_DN24767_c0_g1~~TRINITY_DN24767_c0_g1_i1.p1  ORF type:complete len:530 (+),score=64.46 TRINITY_DN24767_c0_g1_i1:39-1628(+)
MATTIFITSPNGQQHCAGEYEKLTDEIANGQPVWQQRSGNFWLYSGTNGLWIVGSRDARDENFQCSHGMIYCRTPHGGATPDKVSGLWERFDGESFTEDPTIKVATSYYKPFSLRVSSSNGQQRCAGEYVLMSEDMANGLPLWKQKGGKCYIYCGTNGSWVIGGSDAKERNFNCAKGVIYSQRASGGLMPDRIGGVWLRLSPDGFVEDPSIAFRMKPSPLYVQSSNEQQGCAGEFLPVVDKLANGYPLWEHVGGKCWLYSGSNGMWIIGGTDAQAKDFNCTRGVIYCKTPHCGEMPDKMVGPWLRLDGDAFREDAAIVVSSKPASLFVISPNGQHKCSGEYLVVASERVQGPPVWKQKCGNFKICSSTDGTWVVMSDEAPRAVLCCHQAHFGLMPDKVGGPWSRLDGDSLVEDDAIRVTSTLARPAQLHLTTPRGHQKCGGEYILRAGESANGHPLWKQIGGKYWLYSGTNGLWIIGGSGAPKVNFECSRGVIYSGTPHGGQLPHQVRGTWLRLDGKQFLEDTSISVTV